MTVRQRPTARTSGEAFRNTCDYACAVQRFTRPRWWHRLWRWLTTPHP